jgi:hypothetical protein
MGDPNYFVRRYNDLRRLLQQNLLDYFLQEFLMVHQNLPIQVLDLRVSNLLLLQNLEEMKLHWHDDNHHRHHQLKLLQLEYMQKQ